jgi:hypothetical protein
MNQPAEPLQLTQEEQGRLLARVYAFILSDQFTGTTPEGPRTQCRGIEPGTTTDIRSPKKRKTQSTGAAQVLDAEIIQTQEPAL